MARRKLNPFYADDAADVFTPTVKQIKGAPLIGQSGKKKPMNRKKVQKSVSGQVSHEPKDTTCRIHSPTENDVLVSGHAECKQARVLDPQKAVVDREENQETLEKEISEDWIQLVAFFIGDEEYAVEIQYVREINRLVEITRVPRTPEFVLGVINLRGRVIPVIDLRVRFGLSKRENDDRSRIVVVEVKNQTIGLRVDSVSEVLRLPADTMDPPPNIISGREAECVKGVAKLENKLLILLDLDNVLSPPNGGTK